MVADDEFEVASERAPSAPARDTVRAARRRPRPNAAAATPWAVAAIVLVLIGVALVPRGGLPTSGYRPDAVGVLDLDVTQPPAERWRVPIDGWQGGPLGVTLVGDTAVVFSGGDALGLSAATGETRWSVPANAQTCSVGEALTCVDAVGGTGSSVVSVDVGTGAQLRLDLPRTMAATDAGDDLVTLTQDSGGWLLQRVSKTGAAGWATYIDGGGSSTTIESVSAMTQLVVLGDTVYLSFQGRGQALDVRSGAVLDEEVAAIRQMPYGYLLYNASGTSSLLDREGDVLAEDIAIVPDDDPGGAYDLVWNGTQHAIESDGDLLWRVDLSDTAVARIDGVLVTAVGGAASADATLVGHDISTGEEIWSGTPGGPVLAAAGSVLLIMTSSASLTAIDARTGETLWSHGTTPAFYIAATGDGLILHLGNELVRLAWPR